MHALKCYFILKTLTFITQVAGTHLIKNYSKYQAYAASVHPSRSTHFPEISYPILQLSLSNLVVYRTHILVTLTSVIIAFNCASRIIRHIIKFPAHSKTPDFFIAILLNATCNSCKISVAYLPIFTQNLVTSPRVAITYHILITNMLKQQYYYDFDTITSWLIVGGYSGN